MADREDSERLRSDSRSDFVTVSRTPECLLKVHSPKTVQSLQGTFTTYCISFQTNSSAFQLRKSRVRRRFSEFVWLRKKLTKMNNWGTPPPLPAKRFWNVLDPDLIQSRQEQLEKWIYTVLSEEEYLSYSALHLFLQTELSTAEIQDYLDGVLPEDTIRDLWNNHGRRYNYQPHNPLHNFVDQDPVEILFTADDITTPSEANPTSAMATPQPPSPEDPATTTTATTTTVTSTTVTTTAIITATPTPHPEADNTMDSPPKTGGKFQEHSFEGSHDHLQDVLARQNSGSDVEEAQRSSTDWGHLRPGQGANAPQLKQEQQKQAQQKQTQQKQEQAQQKQEQTQQKQERAQQKQERAQQKQEQQKEAQQKQTEQKQEQAQQKQEQAQLKQEQAQAQQKQEQAQQKQEQAQQKQTQQKQEQAQQKQGHQEQEQHEKTQQQISPTQPSSKIAGSQEDSYSQAATTTAGLLTAGTAGVAERKVGKKTGVDCPDLQSSPPAVGLVLSINSD